MTMIVTMTKWTLGWGAMFLLFRLVLFRKRSAHFSNRVVSTVHALATICFAYRTFGRGFEGMFDNIGGTNTEAQALCMKVSLSYFVYDIVYCALAGEIGSVCHHALTIGGLASGVFTGKSGAELVAALFLTEMSSPSLHLRAVLLELGIKDGVFASINNLLFAVVFLVNRLVISPLLVWKTLACAHNAYVVKAGSFGIVAVSLMWGWKIVRMVVKEVRKLVELGGKKKAF